MSFLKKYFNHNNREKRGIWLLLLIITISVGTYFFSDYFSFNSSKQIAESDFKKEIVAFDEQDSSLSNSANGSVSSAQLYEKSAATKSLFRFNPNQLSADEWERLGVPTNVIKTIHKYETAGGRFKSKSDLKKIYGFPTQLYNALEPYIYIESDSALRAQKAALPTDTKGAFKTLLDINTADTNQLKLLRGIGSKLASRIVNYRTALGGFYSKSQLMEVYGLNQQTYNQIEPYITVNEESVTKLNINSADKEILTKHPYVKYKLANLLVQYRLQHGTYKEKESIKNIAIVNDSIYSKLEHYISL